MRSIKHLAALALRTLQPGSACAALLLGLAAGPAAQAAIIPVNGSHLSDLLIPGNSVVIGNTEFSDFTFMTTSTGGALTPDPTTIALNPISTSSTVGLMFQGGVFRATGTQSVDANLSFDVTQVNTTQALSSAELSFTAGATGSGSVSILEVVSNGSQQLGGRSLVVVEAGDLSPVFSDQINFTGESTIHVTKDISILGTAFTTTNGPPFAQMSDFTQTFNFGDGPPTPEPASLGLMLIGGVGLAWYGRRRRGKVARTLVRA